MLSFSVEFSDVICNSRNTDAVTQILFTKKCKGNQPRVNETEIENCIHLTKREVTSCSTDLLGVTNPNSPFRRGG